MWSPPLSQLVFPQNTLSPFHGTSPDLCLVSKQDLASKQRLDEALLLRQARLIKQEIPILNGGLIGRPYDDRNGDQNDKGFVTGSKNNVTVGDHRFFLRNAAMNSELPV